MPKFIVLATHKICELNKKNNTKQAKDYIQKDGVGCTLWMYLTSLIFTLKSGLKSKFYVCVTTLFLKGEMKHAK